jgi:hypothetical protein
MKEIIIAIASVIIGLLLFYIFANESSENQGDVRIIRDTIVEIVTPEPIIIEKAKTKIRYVRDTIIQTRPFVATIDTIIKHDTVRCFYTFPDNILSLHIARQQDTIITHHNNFTQSSIAKRPWWQDPLIILGGVVSGYAIKSMEK